MAEPNKVRTPYSELPDLQKTRRNEKRKLLATEKRGKRPELFPVPIYQETQTQTSSAVEFNTPAKITGPSDLASKVDENLCMRSTLFLVIVPSNKVLIKLCSNTQ